MAPRLFGAITTTDIAPVAAFPTTAAHFAIWNGDPLKTYTITSVGLTTTTSAGAVIIVQLLANCYVTGGNPPISGTVANGPKPLDGLGSGSRAIVASAVTIVNSGFWHPVGSALISAAMTATIGQGVWQNVRGIYTLPPGGIFSLAGFCSAAASAKCQLSMTWEEA